MRSTIFKDLSAQNELICTLWFKAAELCPFFRQRVLHYSVSEYKGGKNRITNSH